MVWAITESNDCKIYLLQLYVGIITLTNISYFLFSPKRLRLNFEEPSLATSLI